MEGKLIKVVTWNINSIRFRIDLVISFLEKHQPDIICIQETKVINSLFPMSSFKNIGYKYIECRGEKNYNGVVIISKIPFEAIKRVNFADQLEARHISVTLEGGCEIHNFYVPAGGDIPDIKLNPKYSQKLKFLESMKDWFLKNKSRDNKIIILGDFNVAPLENDVWSHRQLINVVSHTEPEVLRLNSLQASFDWIDVGRHFVGEKEKLYSWWSYRSRDWKKSNRGRRLDHIWVTPVLEKNLKSYVGFKEYRDIDKPSDHIPLMAELIV